MDTFLSIVNSPAFITAIASAIVLLLNKLYNAKPKWERYEGIILSAVRQAEKAIPDDTESKSVKKFNDAFEYAVRIIETIEGRRLKQKERAEITEGIERGVERLKETGDG